MRRKEKREQEERGGGKNGKPRYWQPSPGKATRAEGSRTDPGELSPVSPRSASLAMPKAGKEKEGSGGEWQGNAAVTIDRHI